MLRGVEMCERETHVVQYDTTLDLGISYYGYLRHKLLLLRVTIKGKRIVVQFNTARKKLF